MGRIIMCYLISRSKSFYIRSSNFVALLAVLLLVHPSQSRECTPEEHKAAASAGFFYPVKILQVKNHLEGKRVTGIDVQWQTSGSQGGKAGKKLLLYFIPDQGLAEFSSSKGYLSEVGKSRVYVSPSVGIDEHFSSGTEKDIQVPFDEPFHIYAAAIACNENSSAEIEKAAWAPWLNADYGLKTLPINTPRVQAIFIGDEGSRNALIKVEYPNDGQSDYSLRIEASSGVQTVQNGDENGISELEDFIQSVDLSVANGSVYVSGINTQWIVPVVGGTLRKVTLIAKDKTSGNVLEKSTSPSSVSWIQDQVRRTLEYYDAPLTSQQMVRLATGLWVEGKGFDGGEYFASVVKKRKQTTPDVITNPAQLASAIKQNPDKGYFPPGRFRFPSTKDGEAFIQGFSRVDFQSIINAAEQDQVESPDLYLGWQNTVSLYTKNANGTMVKIDDCRSLECPYFTVPDKLVTITAPLTTELANRLSQDGLWVRSNEREDSYEPGMLPESERIPSRETWNLRIFRRSQSSLHELGRFSGFLDPRDLLFSPIIKHGYEQIPGNLPNIAPAEIVGWEPLAETPVLAGYNPQLLRLAKSGISAPGQPILEVGDYQIFEDEEFTDEYDGTLLDIGNQPENSLFHLIPNADEQDLEVGKEYRRVLEFIPKGDATKPSLLIPFSYYASPVISSIVVSGRVGESERLDWLAWANDAARILREKTHHYVQVVDLNDWRLGGVYSQLNGMTIARGAEKGELGVLLQQAKPLYSTSLGFDYLHPLQYGLILNLQQSNTRTLANAEKTSISSNDAGTLLNEVDWSDPTSIQNMGFGIYDPAEIEAITTRLAAWNDKISSDNPIGVINPKTICWLTGAATPQCFEPIWWQQNREAVARTVSTLLDVSGFFLKTPVLAVSDAAGIVWEIGGDWDWSKPTVDGILASSVTTVANKTPGARNAVKTARRIKSSAEFAADMMKMRRLTKAAKAGLSKDDLKAFSWLEYLKFNNKRPATSIYKVQEGETLVEASIRRGRKIEEMKWGVFNGSAPSIKGLPPGNFPVIDHFANGIAVSIKSIDAKCHSAAKFAGRLRSYGRKIGNWEGRKTEWNGVVIKESEINARKLLLVFEKNSLSQEQKVILDNFIAEFRVPSPPRNNYPVEVIVEYL